MTQKGSNIRSQRSKNILGGVVILIILIGMVFSATFFYLSTLNRCTDYIFVNSRKISMAVDNSGNIYITGEIFYVLNGSQRIYTADNLVVLKINSSSQVEWIRILNVSNRHTIGLDVVVDSNGFVYVTGGITKNSKNNILLIKMSPSGVLLWTKEISLVNPVTGWEAKVFNGKIYFIGSGRNNNVRTVVVGSIFASNGNLDWISEENYKLQYNFFTDLVIDDKDNLYTLTASDVGNFTINITRYYDNGTIYWRQSFAIQNQTVFFGHPSITTNLIIFPWNRTIIGAHVIHYNTTMKKFTDIIVSLNRTNGDIVNTTTLQEASALVFTENFIYRLLIGYKPKNDTHSYIVLEKYDKHWTLIENKTLITTQDSVQPYQALVDDNGNLNYIDTTMETVKCTGFSVPRLNRILLDDTLARETIDVVKSTNVRVLEISL